MLLNRNRQVEHREKELQSSSQLRGGSEESTNQNQQILPITIPQIPDLIQPLSSTIQAINNSQQTPNYNDQNIIKSSSINKLPSVISGPIISESINTQPNIFINHECAELEKSLENKLSQFGQRKNNTDLVKDIQKIYLTIAQKGCLEQLSDELKNRYKDMLVDSNGVPVKCNAPLEEITELLTASSLQEKKRLYDSIVTKDPNCKSSKFEEFFNKIGICRDLLTQFNSAVDKKDKDSAKDIKNEIEQTCDDITMSNEMKKAYEDLLAGNTDNNNPPPDNNPPPSDCESYFKDLSNAIDDNQTKEAQVLHAEAMIAKCIFPPDLQEKYTTLMNTKTDTKPPKTTNLPAWGAEGEWQQTAQQTASPQTTTATQTTANQTTAAAQSQTITQTSVSTSTAAQSSTALKRPKLSAAKRVKKNSRNRPRNPHLFIIRGRERRCELRRIEI